MIDDGFIETIRRQYALDWNGIHGIAHWERVRANGLRLAEATKARMEVVELFAYLHEHGERAADWARALCGDAFDLEPEDLELLVLACRDHSKGLMRGDITVLTCWDADRLDLGRIGTEPDPKRLCTKAARRPGMIAWAYVRSVR
jgi:uncharacterized protein